ncbi:hypothetical protein PHYBOEH_000893 [Phytophthora boehmeriae]|uniref:G domain-containing protein n=1 Tax=Phytophthora boehmeriae TaxID=109152 RepID=A0A8T1WW00_9STRA|nr:hypothetical protein PHYBOEH_000893 [Phytophthora boehmeriae]
MGALPSHEALAYQTESDTPSDTDHRASLRVLTGMLTRQNTAKKYRGKLLFLGLDGAGKSTLVNHLARISMGDDLSPFLASHGRDLPAYLYPDPTRTQQTASYRVDNSDRYLMLVDPSGRRVCRAKWYTTSVEFVSFSGTSSNLNSLAPTTNVLNTLPILAVLFIIDATDATRFPIVAAELVRFMKLKEHNPIFQKSQLFLVFNKIDHFLPVLPSETPEEPESKEYQQLLSSHKQQQRAAVQEARRELRKSVEYELTMDQRRHPFSYKDPKAPVTAASSSSSKPWSSLFASSMAAPAPTADFNELNMGTPPINSTKKSNTAAAATATSSLFTSAIDCCAQDRESVRALREWINEELKRTQSA